MYRSRTGGNEWEPLTNGLPQRDCYVNVLRDAMAVDSLDPCGIYFGTTGGQVYGSADGGDSLVADRSRSAGGGVGGGAEPAVSHLRRGAGAQVRVVLPAHLRTLAGVGDEIAVQLDAEATVGLRARCRRA